MFVRNVQWVRRRHWYIVYDITVHRVQIIPGMLRTITSLKYYFGVFALRNLGATLTHPISTTTHWKIVIRGALKRSFLCHWKNIKKRYDRTNIDRATAVRTFWRSSLLISTYLGWRAPPDLYLYINTSTATADRVRYRACVSKNLTRC